MAKLEEKILNLLHRADGLIGNPGTGISSSTDWACDDWRKEFEEINGKLFDSDGTWEHKDRANNSLNELQKMIESKSYLTEDALELINELKKSLKPKI